MNYGKLLRAFWFFPALSLVFVVALALAIVAWDPIGVLWRTEPKVFPLNMRFMSACAIDSGKYDSYLLGTSMLQNAPAREFETFFPGSHFANISIDGSSFIERAILLERILTKGGTKRVFYSLDDRYLNQSAKSGESFAFLYDASRLNNIELYFDKKVLKDSVEDMLKAGNRTSEYVLNHDDYNMPGNWFSLESRNERFGGLEKWFAAKYRKFLPEIARVGSNLDGDPFDENVLTEQYEDDIAKAIAYCDQYVLEYVAAYPETDFYLMFPPYSRIRYAMWYQAERRNAIIHREVIRHFVRMASRYANLHVFGFEDASFLENISLYYDTYHYHPDVNAQLTKDICQGRHLLTAANVEEYLTKAEIAALAYDLKGLAEKVDAFLKSEEGEAPQGNKTP